WVKEVGRGRRGAAVIRDAAISAGVGQWAAIQGIAPSLGVEVIPFNVRDAGEIERAVAAFARPATDGMVVTGSALSAVNRKLIVALAARHKLPGGYWGRLAVADGGVIS